MPFRNAAEYKNINAIPHKEILRNEVSCINIKAVYEYVKARMPEQAELVFKDLPENYAHIENPVEVLTDENNWVTNRAAGVVFENAKKILKDENAPFAIGMDSISNKRLGHIQKFFLRAFGGPMAILKRINHINSQFNTNKYVEMVYSSSRHAVVRLHWKENRNITPDICEFNKGIYSAISTIWNLPPADVRESYCFFRGDPYCQYNIDFPGGLRNLNTFFADIRTNKAHLLSALEQIETDKLILKKKYDEVNRLNKELAAKVDTLRAINTASNMLVSKNSTDEILKATMKSIGDVLKYDRAIIMLADKDEQYLEFRYAYGESPEYINKHLQNYRIPLDREENIFVRVLKKDHPIFIKDPNTEGLRKGNLILSNFDISSFVVAPLAVNDKVLGILSADRSRSSLDVTDKDLDDLSIFTNNIAETLLKAQLREEVESSYLNTVKALVQAIEEKDSYTRGHSERVAKISMLIADKMDMEQEEKEFLRLGCLLHDVGKIGISEEIVCKESGLTKEEYSIIKEHPAKGEEIARPIGFLENHLFLIRSHHEWYDGTGYPDRLSGEEIPLGAQIISVADAFDAITSTRPYRYGLKAEIALRRIKEKRGTQFAPRVVDAFVDIFDKICSIC